eukprot:3772499-Prymnesium_polylepis.1
MNAAADDQVSFAGSTSSDGSGTRSEVEAKYDSHTLSGFITAATATEPSTPVALAAAAADAPLRAMQWRSKAATSSDLRTYPALEVAALEVAAALAALAVLRQCLRALVVHVQDGPLVHVHSHLTQQPSQNTISAAASEAAIISAS